MPNYIYRDAEEKYVKAQIVYIDETTMSAHLYHDPECTQMLTFEEAIEIFYNNLNNVILQYNATTGVAIPYQITPTLVTHPTESAPIVVQFFNGGTSCQALSATKVTT